MKQNILFLGALVLIMMLSAFTVFNDSMGDADETIELINRSGGTRSARTTEAHSYISNKVNAYISNKTCVTIEIGNYSGTVWVSIEGTGETIQQVTQVNESGFIILDTSKLPIGNCYLRITLDDEVYEGYYQK